MGPFVSGPTLFSLILPLFGAAGGAPRVASGVDGRVRLMRVWHTTPGATAALSYSSSDLDQLAQVGAGGAPPSTILVPPNLVVELAVDSAQVVYGFAINAAVLLSGAVYNYNVAD